MASGRASLPWALATLATAAGVAWVGGAAASGRAPAVPAWHAPDRAAARVLGTALTHLGDSYTWGGHGPHTWDCSGLTSVVWRTAGGVAGVPRVAADQQRWAVPVPRTQVLAGDLVFIGRPATHVGLALGNGWMVDASASRRQVVVRPIWSASATFGRVRRPGMPPVRGTARRPSPTYPGYVPGAFRGVVPPAGSWAPQSASRLVRRFVAHARAANGARWRDHGFGPAYDDIGLVRHAWAAAGGRPLPRDKARLAASIRPVRVGALHIGDLVFYGAPYNHVGVYLGRGLMVDASRSKGRVVVRRVFPSATVHYGRLR